MQQLLTQIGVFNNNGQQCHFIVQNGVIYLVVCGAEIPQSAPVSKSLSSESEIDKGKEKAKFPGRVNAKEEILFDVPAPLGYTQRSSKTSDSSVNLQPLRAENNGNRLLFSSLGIKHLMKISPDPCFCLMKCKAQIWLHHWPPHIQIYQRMKGV